MNRSTTGRAVFAVALTFLLLMVILPMLYPYGSFVDMGGSPGVLENWNKTSFADPLTRVVYAIGDMFCHQQQSRSFMINGSQMAFCQRDVSILLGFIIGLLLTDILSNKVHTGSVRFLVIGAFFLTITVIEWLAESILSADVLYARAMSGVISGIGIAMLLQYMITKQYEEIMFG